MKKADKPLAWLHGEIKTPPFSSNARIEAGVLLRRQRGEVLSLRIQDERKIWRIVYHIDADAIVILEVFAKTTQQTPKSIIRVCKARLQSYASI
ncbi:MAG: type II toxin-antitoxin system RelE/ParE family toxin [Burkholderiales bacterium]